MKYSKEQIDSMTPEQLKRAIATDVMGLSIYHYDKDWEDNCYYVLWNEALEPVAKYEGWNTGERKTEEEAWADCPDYLNDITAAFEVAEKFKLRGFLLNFLEGNSSEVGWHCTTEYKWHVRGCETPAEAIVKAALLAVMDL